MIHSNLPFDAMTGAFLISYLLTFYAYFVSLLNECFLAQLYRVHK